MNPYYKAVRPDGTSFADPSFRWVPETGPVEGTVVTHPAEGDLGYLSVATVPTDCTGFSWPCRLLTVESVGEVWTPNPASLPNKRAAQAFRVTGEIPAHEVFGRQGEQVAAVIERAGRLTQDEAQRLAAARDAARAARDAVWAASRAARAAAWDASRAARAAAWAAAWDAVWDAARAAARDAVWDAARAAAGALVVRDLITSEQFDLLYGPWASVIEVTTFDAVGGHR